jgi:ABC-type transport system involved in multi-copper enzyme maturation permease subunit
MNFGRFFEVMRLELSHNVRRPLFWVQLLILLFLAQQLASGNASIQSGDARVGGTKAWLTSEFANAQVLVVLVSALYVFFLSIGAGMSLIKDDELRVGEVLRATRLTPMEYVWGKFAGVFVAFAGVLAFHVLGTIVFNHVMPHGTNADSIGPFVLGNYLRPALIFALPSLFLFAGACFAIGALSKQPVLVFALPILVLIAGFSLLWEWSPEWLPLSVNRILQFVDVTGLRWLNQTYLKVDRGVDFYNHAHVALDGLMLAQRVMVTVLGFLSVQLVVARLSARARVTGAQAKPKYEPVLAPAAALDPAPLTSLGMKAQPDGFLAQMLEVARTEFRLLGRHPGLYLFVPLILLQIFGGLVDTGAFDTPRLQTPGLLAMGAMNTLTLLVSFVILFYTTESLQREGSTGIAPIAYSTPVRTAALLSGKALANALLGAAIVFTALIGCAIVLAIQGKVGFSLTPFVIVWGLLLLPTFLLWTSFVAATYAVTNSRFGTYAIGLAVMVVTGWAQLRDKMSWAYNWDLWSATRWTDIAPFQLDRVPLMLNRIAALGLVLFFIVLTLRFFARRERDATRTADRLRTGNLWRSLASLAPWLAAPVTAIVILAFMVHGGWQGGTARKKEHDYWKKNVLTYRDAPVPSIAKVDLALDIMPSKRSLKSVGTYTLVNLNDKPLTAIPLTSGLGWKDVHWTLDNRQVKPENRAGLYVFHPEAPMAVGDTMTIGWAFEAQEPLGISKNGAGNMEFILPGSVVLTGFDSANLAPQLGWLPDIGIKENENRADPKEYPDDFYEGVTRAGLPMAENWFTTRIVVNAPADLMVNATGEKTLDVARGATRRTEWASDQPVRIFNVVLGKWKEKKGDGVVIAYDPQHEYNIPEMMQALEGARRWYSEWFAPYPWKTLRLSEFAGLSSYAQGSPGNITFSESIGFLTRSKPEASAAFWVTAHEAAHQWWPNMAMSGAGPGGDVLSEGMAHFSTILLCEQVQGEAQRMAFCRNIEKRYGDFRQRDSERPLVKLNGELPADGRIIYDKGGWALWMMFRLMGRENGLAAQKDYMARYRDSRDHPVLQDYLAVMREHAPDTTAFDGYVKQWFYDVVVPQYLVTDPVARKSGDGWIVTARVKNVGTGTMPIEVAAFAGKRFPKKNEKAEKYVDARAPLTLAAGQELPVTIPCHFKPEKLVVDPDVLVLQLEREKATVPIKLQAGGGEGLTASR